MTVRSSRSQDHIILEIGDNGCGIPAENLSSLFDPFFTTKGPDEGEGIGLFVVRQIVEKYNGGIEFESNVGEGTVCTITFPAQEPKGEDL